MFPHILSGVLIFSTPASHPRFSPTSSFSLAHTPHHAIRHITPLVHTPHHAVHTTPHAAAMHDGRPGHSRHVIFSTPEGVRRGWSPSAASMRAMAQGIAGAIRPRVAERGRRSTFSTPQGMRRSSVYIHKRHQRSMWGSSVA